MNDGEKGNVRKENKKLRPNNKVKYCPIISSLLDKNNKRLKNSIVFSMLEFLSNKEKLSVRLVCKRWNENVKFHLPFLTEENYLNLVAGQRGQGKAFQVSSGQKDKLGTSYYEAHCFESERKFSQRNVLVKLISSKNFGVIKNKISLGKMARPKKLVGD